MVLLLLACTRPADHKPEVVDDTATGACTTSVWYDDADGDGFGDPGQSSAACAPDGSQVADSTDCDDADVSSHPGAAEVCDGADNDCDEEVDEDAVDRVDAYTDADGDGYGDPATQILVCDPAGSVTVAMDCDDADASVHPAATESCDGVDQDCDGTVDDWVCEGVTDQVAYTDAALIVAGSAASDAVGGGLAGGEDLDGDGAPDLARLPPPTWSSPGTT